MGAGYSEDAARQKISRDGKQIIRLQANLFPKRTSFLYLKEHENTGIFFENLFTALKTTNSIHYCAIAALAARGGKASLQKFMVLSGAPIMRKRQKNFDLLVRELIQSKLAFKKIENNEEIIELNSYLITEPLKEKEVDVLNVLEELIAAAMGDWLKKNGLGSYNKLKRIGDFNSYHWDITVPSYVFPFCTKNIQATPGFMEMSRF